MVIRMTDSIRREIGDCMCWRKTAQFAALHNNKHWQMNKGTAYQLINHDDCAEHNDTMLSISSRGVLWDIHVHQQRMGTRCHQGSVFVPDNLWSGPIGKSARASCLAGGWYPFDVSDQQVSCGPSNWCVWCCICYFHTPYKTLLRPTKCTKL